MSAITRSSAGAIQSALGLAKSLSDVGNGVFVDSCPMGALPTAATAPAGARSAKGVKSRESIAASTRDTIHSIASTNAPTNPTSGRYKKRSAMMLPIVISRLDVGRNATKKNRMKNDAALLRFQR